MPCSNVVLVTGASSGIGKACTDFLQLYGYRVYAGSRSNPEFPLDVTREESVNAAVARILDKEGRLDAVINNAGIGLAGAIEETTPAEAQHQLDTNLFGPLRVIRAVLPQMRGQRSGRIVNIGSIGGVLAIPYQGVYSASKFALEALTEALRLEVKQFGIYATVIEPGDHRTDFTRNRTWTADSNSASPYHPNFQIAVYQMMKDEQHGSDPGGVARVVLKVLQARRPRQRYVTGPLIQRAALLLKRLAPDSLTERILELYYS